MKRLRLLTASIAFFLSLNLFASVSDQLFFSAKRSVIFSPDHTPGILQERPAGTSFDNMMSNIQRVHRAVFNLPYEYEYIKNTLMPQIEAKRAEIAPHWPGRELYGEDQQKGNALFKSWYEQYPHESTAYIAFVDQFVQEHSN